MLEKEDKPIHGSFSTSLTVGSQGPKVAADSGLMLARRRGHVTVRIANFRQVHSRSGMTRRGFLQTGSACAVGVLGTRSANAWASGNEQVRNEAPSSPPETSPSMLSIENETVRLATVALEGRWGLEFAVKRADGSWRPLLATGAAATDAPWESKQRLVSEDPQIAWKQDGRIEESEAFFTNVEALDARTLRLTGEAAGEVIEERVTLAAPGRVHIEVRSITAAPIDLSQLMSNFYLVPDGKAFGYALPLDLAWLPVLHRQAGDQASDRFAHRW